MAIMTMGTFLLLVAVLGCISGFLKKKDEEVYIKFSHKLHAEQGAECLSCHKKAAEAEEAGAPGHDECKECHEIDMEKPDSPDCMKCHADKDKKVVWPRVHTEEDIIFSHKRHREEKIACDHCHKGIAESDVVGKDHVASMELCLDCHEGNPKEADCALCHTKLRKDMRPKSHVSKTFRREHGTLVSYADYADASNRCYWCHTQSGCAECHQTEKPRNHTHTWRVRSHGMVASIDRHRCYICHQEDQCIRCHKNTPPRTHRAGWGSNRNRHCLHCHDPNFAESSCRTCHRGGAAAHGGAANIPNNSLHNTAVNCSMPACHGNRHPDPSNGQKSFCVKCHK
jgi:hypothetical protein